MSTTVQTQPGATDNGRVEDPHQTADRDEEPDRVSYVDSDTHAAQYCCCLHGWKDGADPRWYYPYDKGIYRMFGLCCMWVGVCAFFPCSLCIKECRDIICMSDQYGTRDTTDERDRDEEEEIPEA